MNLNFCARLRRRIGSGANHSDRRFFKLTAGRNRERFDPVLPAIRNGKLE